MTAFLFDYEHAISLGSISSEEDLKPRGRITINPPPEDGRCQCCERHLSELQPFGGAGDPLVGDFSGELLVKGFRSFYGQVEPGWQCRDCVALSDDEYFGKRQER